MTVVAHRLVDATPGLYRHEREDLADLVEASDRAMQWYGALGVVAIAVLDEDRVDQSYPLPGLVDERVPASWRETLAPKRLHGVPLALPETSPAPETRPTAEPDFLGVGIGAMPAAGPLCRCCRGPEPTARYPGDLDTSPVGRLHAYRCPDCGRKLDGLTMVEIQRMYLGGAEEW